MLHLTARRRTGPAPAHRRKPGPAPKTREVDPATVRKLLGQRERQHRRLAAEQATLAVIEAELTALMDGAEEATAGGELLFTYRPDGTFASRRFADDNPGLAAEFSRPMPRLDVEALTVAHPELVRQYRARVLRIRGAAGR